MNNVKTEKGICDVCKKESEYTVVCCSACGAISYRYCLNCLNNGREPYNALVGMGLYYENINENFKEKILNPSLKFHNKTVEQFNADVKKLDDDMRAYFEQCEKEMKSMSKGDKNEDLF